MFECLSTLAKHLVTQLVHMLPEVRAPRRLVIFAYMYSFEYSLRFQSSFSNLSQLVSTKCGTSIDLSEG